MTTTYEGALDEIFTLFKTNWDSSSTAIAGYIPVIEWPGINTGNPPDASKFWIRISAKGVGSEQSTLSESVVQLGSRRFESFGLIFVQLFAPIRQDAFPVATKLAMLAQNILRSKLPNVILRNARINELPLENGAIRTNIVAEFEFDQIY